MSDVVVERAGERFLATVDGEPAGQLVTQGSDPVRLLHTVVEPRFEGRGVGSELARTALAALAADGAKVEVLCPFVIAWQERHPGQP